MNDAQIKQSIFQVVQSIAPEVDLNQWNPNENLMEALNIDSFDFLNFIVGLDEALGVGIPEGDYGKIDTLNKLVDYLSHKAPA
ncbi:MAG TPA: phosphopantetheine-binding protein [Candidatus Bipolaricaulota bacterium]